MIEVEKKFTLKDSDEARLIENAEFLGEKKFTDIYYDTDNYSLTTKDIWLRGRDGRFELKIPFNDSIEERLSDQYQELETDREISEYLKLPQDKPLADTLVENGYKSFCNITTTRRKYKKDGYILDLDTVDFGYKIAEIEYMTDDVSKIRDITEKIVQYGRSLGLTEGVVRGKVVEYVRRNNPPHFQALVDAKVIK